MHFSHAEKYQKSPLRIFSSVARGGRSTGGPGTGPEAGPLAGGHGPPARATRDSGVARLGGGRVGGGGGWQGRFLAAGVPLVMLAAPRPLGWPGSFTRPFRGKHGGLGSPSIPGLDIFLARSRPGLLAHATLSAGRPRVMGSPAPEPPNAEADEVLDWIAGPDCARCPALRARALSAEPRAELPGGRGSTALSLPPGRLRLCPDK